MPRRRLPFSAYCCVTAGRAIRSPDRLRLQLVPMWHPLRLAEDYAMADILTGGAGHLWRRARLSPARGRDLRLAIARPERQPGDVRGRRRGPLQGVRGQAVLAPGQVLNEPARGAE